ncbi:MAG: tRNA pseudouridine(55) synthase TruB [Actinobacteria bacterium]|nr:tRNA pseudouridine(55) synthase TruB [Actinomycetota bacterium]
MALDAAGGSAAATRAGGVVLVDKPAGPSSFAVVRDVRRRFGQKAGHAGTLDPFATGLLVCLLGRSTRLARYLVGLDKRYVTEIRLGLRTTTGDGEGEILEETELPSRLQIAALEGEVELRIPRASAVKIDGERAYRLQRRGVDVEMPVRRSTIHALDVLRFDPPLLELRLHVSSGTYVRAIADALGGHCRTLRRTAVGSFRVEDADPDRVLAPLAALVHLPERELAPDEVEAVRAGRVIPGAGDGPIALWASGALVAVGRAADGSVRPETVIG